MSYQPIMQSIALKMVGTLEDAEDIVQDTFEKWLKIDANKILNTKAYLMRSVSNNSLQFLTSLKQKVSLNSSNSGDHFDIEDHHQAKSFFDFDMESRRPRPDPMSSLMAAENEQPVPCAGILFENGFENVLVPDLSTK